MHPARGRGSLAALRDGACPCPAPAVLEGAVTAMGGGFRGRNGARSRPPGGPTPAPPCPEREAMLMLLGRVLGAEVVSRPFS